MRPEAQHSAVARRGGDIRVVLGEDSFLAREAIAGVLERAEGIELVAVGGDLDTIRATIDELQPDVVVTDIRMPPDNTDEGIRLASELRNTHPEIGVVVLSQHVEPTYAALLFEHGSGARCRRSRTAAPSSTRSSSSSWSRTAAGARTRTSTGSPRASWRSSR